MGLEGIWRCDICKDTAVDGDVSEWSRLTIEPLVRPGSPPLVVVPDGMAAPVGAITPGPQSQGVPAIEPPGTTSKAVCHKPSCSTKAAKDHHDAKAAAKKAAKDAEALAEKAAKEMEAAQAKAVAEHEQQQEATRAAAATRQAAEEAAAAAENN